MEKEGCNPFSSNSLLGGTKNHPLTKAVVHHDQKRVKPRGKGEVCNKVTEYLVEREGTGRGDRSSRGVGRVSVYFVLLASSTNSDEGTDEGGEAGPPEVGSDQLMGFEEAWMASGGMVVAATENVAAKVAIRRDVDAAFIGEDTINVLPIG